MGLRHRLIIIALTVGLAAAPGAVVIGLAADDASPDSADSAALAKSDESASPNPAPIRDAASRLSPAGGALNGAIGVGLVEAIDPSTGRTLWWQRPLPSAEAPGGARESATSGVSKITGGAGRGDTPKIRPLPPAPPVIVEGSPSEDAKPQGTLMAQAASGAPITLRIPDVAAGESAGDLQAAQEPAQEEVLISNVYFDTDLREALRDVAEQAGVTIVAGLDIQGFVSLEMEDVTLTKALQLLLAGTGYVVKETPDYILVTTPDPSGAAFGLISETRAVMLVHGTPDTVLNLLAEGFQTYVRANTEMNMLSVTAPPALLERILADIELFDIAPRQMVLDVRVIVMETNQAHNIGLLYEFPVGRAGTFSNSGLHGPGDVGTAATWPWALQLGLDASGAFADPLSMALNLLIQNQEATVVASPRVIAQDGKEAQISVRTEEFFEIVTQGFVINSQLERIDTGTLLKITPRIGHDGHITLKILAEVSDVIARGENNLPVITRRTVESVVRVPNGGTAVIAGLEDNRRRRDERRVPFISRVPLIGRLFRNDNSSDINRQVAVFVTPHLIGEDSLVVGNPETSPNQFEPIVPVGQEFKRAMEEILRGFRGGGR